MNGLFSSIYLLSKVASALLNVAAIAIFTRLATDIVYGEYLIGFALSFIIFSLTMQWLMSAHFGQQSRSRAARIAGATIVFTAAATILGLALIPLAVGMGIVPDELAWGCAALLVGLPAYFIANEIGRANLLVGAVTAAALLRGLFTLCLGSLSLWLFHSAEALMVAVATGHVLSVVPIAIALRRSIWSEGFEWPSWSDYRQLWLYGWPLLIAGGASAVSLNIDRLLLYRFHSTAEVASYGVTLDFIKQCFIIVGETVTVSYVSLAKSFHGDGLDQKTTDTLRQAFVTICFLATFGVAFFLLLGKPLLGVLLDSSYQEALPIIPLLALANACLILRAYYFAQVIYFTNSVRLELVSTIIALLVGTAIGLWLIPSYGMTGAALAFLLAQFASLLSIFSARETWRLMPVDIPRLFIVIGVGVGLVLIGETALATLSVGAASVFNLVMISIVSAILLVRWDMFDAAKIWRHLGRTLGLRQA